MISYLKDKKMNLNMIVLLLTSAIIWAPSVAEMRPSFAVEDYNCPGAVKILKTIAVTSLMQCHHICDTRKNCVYFAVKESIKRRNGRRCRIFKRWKNGDFKCDNMKGWRGYRMIDFDHQQEKEETEKDEIVDFRSPSAANYLELEMQSIAAIHGFTMCLKFIDDSVNSTNPKALLTYQGPPGKCWEVSLTTSTITIGRSSTPVTFNHHLSSEALICISYMGNGTLLVLEEGKNVTSYTMHSYQVKQPKKFIFGQKFDNQSNCDQFDSTKSFGGEMLYFAMWGQPYADLAILGKHGAPEPDVFSWDEVLTRGGLKGEVTLTTVD